MSWQRSSEVTTWLAGVSTATLTTQLFTRGFRSRFLHGPAPLSRGRRMIGSARTLRFAPMREDLDTLASLAARRNAQRAVIEEVGPGEVLVIDAMRTAHAGVLGDILARRLRWRGAAGIVTDGAVRDAPAIAELGLPTYAAARCANPSIAAYHPVDYDVPIGCGGVLVEVGDAVVGDDEGVVVIPSHLVAEVAEDAYAQELRESFVHERVEEGASVFDVYPMNEETRRAFDAWARQRESGRAQPAPEEPDGDR